jgi:two-component system sensor histidine kinase QseC
MRKLARLLKPTYWIVKGKRLKTYCTSSLERFLVTSFLIMLTLLTFIIAVINYNQLCKQNDRLFEVQLIDAGQLLNALAGSQLKQENSQELHTLLTQPDDETLQTLTNRQIPHHIKSYLSANSALSYQIWNTDTNALMVASSNAPATPLSHHKEGLSQTIDTQGVLWHTYALTNYDAHIQIIIGIQDSYKSQVNVSGFIHDFSVIILLYVIVAVLTIFIIRFSLTHLKQVADAVQNRNPESLSAIDTRYSPQEVLPLILALNQLFRRIESALQREKNFTADAAHELRTPLAALKMQAEVAMRAKDDQQRLSGLRNVLAGSNRCSHVVDQLLTLSRLEPEAELKDPHPLNLKKIAQELLAELALLAVRKNIVIELDAPDDTPLIISGNEIAIGILLRNLVDNAIRYSPTNSAVQVTLSEQSHTITLCVSDNGPGVSEVDMPRLFSRFFRATGNQETGSGLGLAIVQQIALLHHAKIYVQKPVDHSGLEITVIFPKG